MISLPRIHPFRSISVTNCQPAHFVSHFPPFSPVNLTTIARSSLPCTTCTNNSLPRSFQLSLFAHHRILVFFYYPAWLVRHRSHFTTTTTRNYSSQREWQSSCVSSGIRNNIRYRTTTMHDSQPLLRHHRFFSHLCSQASPPLFGLETLSLVVRLSNSTPLAAQQSEAHADRHRKFPFTES